MRAKESAELWKEGFVIGKQIGKKVHYCIKRGGREGGFCCAGNYCVFFFVFALRKHFVREVHAEDAQAVFFCSLRKKAGAGACVKHKGIFRER